MKKFKKLRLFIAITFIFIGLLTISSIYTFVVKLRPRIINITQSYARNIVSQAVDDEVKKVMLEKFFSYDELAIISRDEKGRVTSISSNTTMVNRFANDLGIAVGDKLDKISVAKNKMYISSLIGLDLFAGMGPKIGVRFSPISVTTADIFHTFEEAGINQTLHTVNLTVSVDMAIVLPLAHSSVKVDSTMPISQTLIVGTVPDAYFDKNITQAKKLID